MTVDGALDGPGLLAYVNQALAPTLAKGDVVVMDNVGTHKVAGVREAIEARGATLLYLPPYSPDFNPIEEAFAKIKAFLRAAAARSLDALLIAIRDALDACAPDECANYFVACRYDAFRSDKACRVRLRGVLCALQNPAPKR
jgi:transposase